MSTRLRSSTRASTAASDFLADQGGDTKTKQESRSRAKLPQAPRGNELLRLRNIMFLALISAWTVTGVVLYCAYNDILKLYPKSITKPDALKGFNARFEYSVRYQILLAVWLLFNVCTVIFVRFSKRALNPLVPSTEVAAQCQKNILNNSIEQVFISVLLQFAFASFAEPSLVMKMIPAVNFLVFFGRIAYFLGYPMYRTFGITLTAFPSILMAGYNLYKFGSFLDLY